MDSVIEIGATAPEFQLPDLRGNLVSLKDLKGSVVVLNFWSSECDWCERVDQELTNYVTQWRDRATVLWIASNAHETREQVEKVAVERNIPIVLLDEQLKAANLYGVQTTPHFFVLDLQGKLAYQGAWDDITFRQRVANISYVPQAVQALINGSQPDITQTQAYGCTLVRFTQE
jgi:peroxiredoxin